MSAASNPIALSSSPECATPRVLAHECNHSNSPPWRQNPPEQILSPTTLLRLPTRSRYLQEEGLSAGPRTARRDKEETSPKSSAKRRKSTKANSESTKRKSSSGSATVLGDVRPSLLAQKTNAPKKTVTSHKKRMKCGKSNNTTDRILTGKVAKSGSMKSRESEKPTSDALTAKSLRQKSAKDTDYGGEDGLQLEAALKRRLDWTPTKDTPITLVDLSQEEAKHGGTGSFGSLVAEYRNNPHASKYSSGEGVSKELAGESQDDDNPPEAPKRPKQRQKKFTTLTARVTARYQSDCIDSGETGDTDESLTPASAKGLKSKRKGTNKSKRQEPQAVILPPDEAVKSLNEQDLIFGTCSQLEREDSPTMIRDMQTAIDESEKNIPLPSSESSLSSTSSMSRLRASRGLWSIAARDLDGSLISTEIIDLTESPISKTPTCPMAHEESCGNNQDVSTAFPATSSTEEILPLSDETPQLPQRSDKRLKSWESELSENDPLPIPDYESFTDAHLSEKMTEFGFKPLKNRRKAIELLKKCWKTKYIPSRNVNDRDEQPSGPVSQISHVSATPRKIEEKTRTSKRPDKKTKPKTTPKSKGGMKLDTTRGTTSDPYREHARDSASGTQPDKTLSALAYIDVEEIEDSEEEIIPSPSRLSHLSIGHTPTSLPVSNNTSGPSPVIASSELVGVNKGNSTEITVQITRAVRAQPSSLPGTRNRPTWLEKILMYDPIILEDFTAWLNTKGLGLINEDREVNVGLVRTWCEVRGICCYRRLNKD
ncbi:structure-specific endonuclease subunit slx4 [Aspergillus ambiguus]|uniref:protein slx4 n=1 Tax=Aspergillus ambiguus TaxID=176160 RepID=UPI003CCD819D